MMGDYFIVPYPVDSVLGCKCSNAAAIWKELVKETLELVSPHARWHQRFWWKNLQQDAKSLQQILVIVCSFCIQKAFSKNTVHFKIQESNLPAEIAIHKLKFGLQKLDPYVSCCTVTGPIKKDWFVMAFSIQCEVILFGFSKYCYLNLKGKCAHKAIKQNVTLKHHMSGFVLTHSHNHVFIIVVVVCNNFKLELRKSD